ncbi:hypothetical protein [Bradyrhizobium sp. ORS 86]|uniref:hypothetical protein n=1 Tax=Bradyrhizobium sp. ORS 86 TaxID=1685970 RepID=UPI00388E80BC
MSFAFVQETFKDLIKPNGPTISWRQKDRHFADSQHKIMRRAILSLAAALWLAFICYATLSPLASRPGLLGDTALVVFLEHVCAYALLGLLLRFAICSRPVLIIVLVASIACMLECLQVFTADRHARLLDAAEKIAGGWLGVTATPMVATIASHLSKMRPELWTRGKAKRREPQPHSH